jgi:hypothetical protein
MRRERRAANVQKMRQGSRSIEMQIDELVLHGFSVADRYIIGDALTHELHQLFETNQVDISLSNNAHVDALNARQIIIPSNARPTLIGAKVAKAVHGSLNASNMRGQR